MRNNREKAKLFGSIVLRQGIVRQRQRPLKVLIATVRIITGTPHYDVLARLLCDAYEAVGKHKSFSAEQLKKFGQRRLGSLKKARSNTNNLIIP